MSEMHDKLIYLYIDSFDSMPYKINLFEFKDTILQAKPKKIFRNKTFVDNIMGIDININETDTLKDFKFSIVKDYTKTDFIEKNIKYFEVVEKTDKCTVFKNLRDYTSQEIDYLNLLKKVLYNGRQYDDRTGTGVLKLFGENLSFDIKSKVINKYQIPLFTTKNVYFKGIVEELLWFLKGCCNSKELEKNGINIWKGNSSAEFLRKNNLDYEEGELGPIYSNQWVNWGGDWKTKTGGINQIENIINEIKRNPHSRRLVLNAWNVSDLDKMALPPCHVMYIFDIDVDYSGQTYLNCLLTLRSSDLFLGLPFNITSTSILTCIIAKCCNILPGKINISISNAHIYLNHIEQVKEQITRMPYEFPELKINKNINNYSDIVSLNFSDFELLNYKKHSTIKAPMAV